MLLPLRDDSQPRGDRERLLDLAQLDKCLDEIRRDREHPGLVHSFACGVLPDRGEALGRACRLVCEQRGDPTRAQTLEPVPLVSRWPSPGRSSQPTT